MIISNPKLKIRRCYCSIARKTAPKALKVKFTRRVGKIRKPSRLRVKLAGAYGASLETPLAECFRCARVATYQNYCYFHWQERACYGCFLPETCEAVISFNRALAS